MGRLQPAPDTLGPFAGELASFAEYLRGERGLAPTSIEGRCSTLYRFLSQMNPSIGSLHEITVALIDDALAVQIPSGG
jgi:hypothetical protein